MEYKLMPNWFIKPINQIPIYFNDIPPFSYQIIRYFDNPNKVLIIYNNNIYDIKEFYRLRRKELTEQARKENILREYKILMKKEDNKFIQESFKSLSNLFD
jgi:hypothetical protein